MQRSKQLNTQIIVHVPVDPRALHLDRLITLSLTGDGAIQHADHKARHPLILASE